MDDLKLFSKTEDDVESLINTVRIVSDDTGMQFGLSKCAVIALKRGKAISSRNIRMPDWEEFRSLGEGGSYKYLGVLETDQIKHEEMKGKIEAEYFSRVRKVLKSKLNARNTIKAINTWSVSLVRYVAGIIEWNKEELQRMNRKRRKLLTMHGGLHPRSDADGLYVPRDKGGAEV